MIGRRQIPMGDEPYTKQQTTSSRSSARSTSPHQLAYATERAKILFGSYRRTDANEPDIYVAAIARVLSIFDADLIREVTDPLTGVATSEKFAAFMPNAGELKLYCEGRAAHRERLRRLGSIPPVDFNRPRLAPPERQPGDLATIFVPATHPRYSKLVEWADTADPRLWKFGPSSDGRQGIWVSYGTWDLPQASAPRPAELPQKLELSAEAKRVMGMVDAERSGNLPVDQAAE